MNRFFNLKEILRFSACLRKSPETSLNNCHSERSEEFLKITLKQLIKDLKIYRKLIGKDPLVFLCISLKIVFLF